MGHFEKQAHPSFCSSLANGKCPTTHTSTATRKFLDDRRVSTVWQSPYSPDLNMCDRFLFSALKAALRDKAFQSHLEVEDAALNFFRRISLEVLQDEVDKLYDDCQAIIDGGGPTSLT